MALAIGYDWLYPQLSVQTKEVIEKAIVEKGLKPSFDERYNWFVNAVHNWSQVCHAGVTYGALAIWEKEPELSRTVINRAIDKISIPMGHYALTELIRKVVVIGIMEHHSMPCFLVL